MPNGTLANVGKLFRTGFSQQRNSQQQHNVKSSQNKAVEHQKSILL